MSEFSDIILGALDLAGAEQIVEIGAEYGGMTKLLAERAVANGGALTSIDPAPKLEMLGWAATCGLPIRLVQELSLAVLPGLANVDAWLVDGDHNWFTVYHELLAIDAACRRDGKPMLVILHDIGWPVGRRDMYYAPDQIPADHLHPHDFDGGTVPGTDALLPHQGFRGMGHFALARHEGGPRNGVLTAVEDFIEHVHAQGRTLAFAEIPAVFGLGILFDQDAPWSEALGQHVLPFHDNALLRALETNRLANYLRVIELQDERAAP
jgi:hypothetical protein